MWNIGGVQIITYHNPQWWWHRGRLRAFVSILKWPGVLAFRIAGRVVWINF